MNCKDFESMIHELVSRRVADKTKQLEALEHAGHCLWCALRLDEETKLTQSLQAFAGTLHAQRAAVRVEEELLQAFRERTSRSPAARFGLTAKRLWRGLSWGLAFAATVATAWIVISHWPRLHPRSSAPPPQVANNQPLASSEASQAKQEQPWAPGKSDRQVTAQSEGVGSHVAARQSDEPAGRSSTNRKLQVSVLDHYQQHSGGQVAPHGRPERAALDESASERTTDFISLGTCDDSQCMDEATLVRVRLPAEALLAFGLAMDNDYASEGFVQADVALASDGVPFAIRFVD
jgi:hypothetical protein